MRLTGVCLLLLGILLTAGALAAELNAPVVAPAVGIVPAVAAAAAVPAPQQVVAVAQPIQVAAAGSAAVAQPVAPVAAAPAAPAPVAANPGKGLTAEAVKQENGTADMEFFLPFRKFDSIPGIGKSDAAAPPAPPAVASYPAPPPAAPAIQPPIVPPPLPPAPPPTMAPTLLPYLPPVETTQPPYVPPVETTQPPYVPPVETTQPPYVPPLETTQPPYVSPVETTQPPYVPPVESTQPPYVPPVETAQPPYVPPIETTQPPYVPPVVTTQPPYVPPVETTQPPYVPPVETLPPYVPPVETLPPYVPPVETQPPYVPPEETTQPPYVPAVDTTTLPPYVPPVEESTTLLPYLPPVEDTTTTPPPYVPPVEESTTQPPYVPPVESTTTQPPYVPPVESTTTQPPYVPPESSTPGTPSPYQADSKYAAPGMDTIKKAQGSISAEIEKIDKAIADIDQTIQKTDQKDRRAPPSIKKDSSQASFKRDDSSEEQGTVIVPKAGGIGGGDRHPPPSAAPIMTEPSTTATEMAMPAELPTLSSASVEPAVIGGGGGGDEESLIRQFKQDELKYQECPTSPKETRRMFEHPAGVHEAKVAALARFSHFMKTHRMRGQLEDKEGVCEKKMIKCSTSTPYRTFDGTCNNLENPFWGSVDTPYRRIVTPAYMDGFSVPRGARYSPETGYISVLPSPRKISDVVFDEGVDTTTESDKNTHMLMQWGQFLDHDIIATSRDFFDCCDPKIRNLPRCFPISVPAEDSFFPQFGRTCLDFTRSNAHCDKSLRFAEQFNKQTAFIDGSVIYGNNDKLAMLLRGDGERKEGKLVGNSRLPNFLPSKFDLQVKNSPLDKATDFVAGDKRAETQASLTSMHNLFFNEHNRIAEALFKELQQTSRKTGLELDELVYQETRRLVIAEMQQITYQEFLPQVIGLSGMAKNELNKEECIYDPKMEPSIINSFATAAFRFGHSLVQSIFRGEGQPWRLGKFYADSRFARLNNGHGFVMELLGLSKQPCQRADVHLTKQLTQELYANNDTGHGVGHDLGATNIQRGRDHGIPAYNTFRKLCGLPALVSLSSPPADMDPEAWKKIISVYKGVDEIDLFVGGLAEKPRDGIVGPTFACIIGRQFKELMVGDRFFYHHTGGPGIKPLKGAALAEISKRRLSDIICEATDMSDLQANVFIQPGNANPAEPCAAHRKLNIKAIAAEIKA